MQNSDLIALGAMAVAGLSALYARHARDASRRANEIAVHFHLRPLRLAVYQSMKQFVHYCSTYRTLQCIGNVNGTRELVDQIENFKWEIEQHGPLDIPVIEEKVSELQKKGWQLQRVLDRIAGVQNTPADRAYDTAEENVDGLIDWFANEHRTLKVLFRPYLEKA
jgi:hypothetical protein